MARSAPRRRGSADRKADDVGIDKAESPAESSGDEAPEEVSNVAGHAAHQAELERQRAARETVQAERLERKRRATERMRERAETKRQRKAKEDTLSMELLAQVAKDEGGAGRAAEECKDGAEHGQEAVAAERARPKGRHTRFKDKTRAKVVRRQGFNVVRGAAAAELAMLESGVAPAARSFEREAAHAEKRRVKGTLFASRRRATKPAAGFACL